VANNCSDITSKLLREVEVFISASSQFGFGNFLRFFVLECTVFLIVWEFFNFCKVYEKVVQLNAGNTKNLSSAKLDIKHEFSDCFECL